MLDELKKLVKKFEKAQATYADCGAEDTEPDTIFQGILVKAIIGAAVDIPSSANGWHLYSEGNKAKTKRAVKALFGIAHQCKNLIGEVKINESSPIRHYIKDYCWRISW